MEKMKKTKKQKNKTSPERKKETRKEREKRVKSAFYRYRKFLEEMQVPFVVEYTHGRRTVKSKLGERSFSVGKISMRGMNFIKTIKNHILKAESFSKIPVATKQEFGLQYLLFNKKYMHQKLTKVTELDLKSAYWDAAYKMGLIDKADYFHGLRMSKVERLASLGTLARVLKQRTFDGKKYSKAKYLDKSENSRHVWFAISNEIDRVMKKCAKELKDQLIFYWIDALFFIDTPANRKLVQEKIKECGYKAAFVKISFVELKTERAYAYSPEKGDHIDPVTGLRMRFFSYNIKKAEQFKILGRNRL